MFLRESALQRRKAELTLAQIREKLPNGRLAPNLAHMCKFIWEWIYAKQIAPRETRGALGGFYVVNNSKYMDKLSDWHQLWFTSADSSWNGHRLNTSAPQYPRGHWGMGVTNSKVLGSCQTAAPIGTEFGTRRQIRLGMDIAKYNSPLNTTGGISGVLGVTHLSMGKLPNGWTDWHQIRYTSVDSSGNGHRKKDNKPHDTPRLHFGGGALGGQQFKSLGNVVKWLDRLGIHFAHIIMQGNQ